MCEPEYTPDIVLKSINRVCVALLRTLLRHLAGEAWIQMLVWRPFSIEPSSMIFGQPLALVDTHHDSTVAAH